MLNSMMRGSLAHAEKLAFEKAEQQRKQAAENALAEQRRQAEIAAQESKRKEDDAKRVQEEAEAKRLAFESKQRIDTLIVNAKKEANGEIDGIENMQAIYNEAAEVIAEFITTNPLQSAILADKLEVVKFLVDKGLRYDEWRDVVDEGTPLYTYLSSKASPRNTLR